MRLNTHIKGSFQSAAKLAILIALTAFSASALGQQNTSTTPTAANEPDHVFTSIEDMLSVVPSTIDPRPGGSWNSAGLEQASASLRSSINGKNARLAVQVEFVSKLGTAGYRLVVPRQQLPEPHPYGVTLSLFFKEEKADKLATITKGQVVTVVGSVTSIKLSAQGPTMASLYLTIRDADIIGTGTPVTAAKVSDPSPNSSSAVVPVSTPSAPTPRPISATEHVFHSVEEILSFIPAAINTRPNGQWDKAALEQASAFLRLGTKDKAAKLSVLVNVSRKAPVGYHLYVGSPTLSEPRPYVISYKLALSDDKETKLMPLKYGQSISVIGRITDCYVQLHGSVAALHIDMQDADISDTPPPIPVSTTTPAPSVKVELPSTPAAVSASTPVATDSEHLAISQNLALAKGWDSPMQGGTATLEDLARLFNDAAKPDVNLTGDNTIMVFQDIPYLTPIRDAIRRLDLSDRLASKVLIACPGLPNGSLYYYAFDGLFEGHFNRIYLVVDRADQLISVQLVDEHPRNRSSLLRDLGWHTYNFINYRTKSMNTLRIQHLLDYWSKGGWREVESGSQSAARVRTPAAKWNVLRIRSKLLDPIRHQVPGVTHLVDDAKVLEEVNWYVPRPIVELILTCVQKSAK